MYVKDDKVRKHKINVNCCSLWCFRFITKCRNGRLNDENNNADNLQMIANLQNTLNKYYSNFKVFYNI